MKRPAESQLTTEDRGGAQPNPFAGASLSAASSGNPFAGVSLFAAPAGGASGGLFTAAASNATVGGGFATSTTSTLEASATPAATASVGAAGDGKPSNPFMGLSLFSAPASGGIFSTAAESIGSPGSASGGFGGLSGFTVGASSSSTAPATTSSSPGAQATTPAAEDTEEAAPTAEADTPEEDSQAAEGADATGEEDEQVVFRAEGKLWKLVRSDAPGGADAEQTKQAGDTAEEKKWRWQERGCGVVHINRHRKTGSGRLVMRMRGVLKLLLNTPVLPTTKYEKLGQKSVRFMGVGSEEDSSMPQVALCAYRLSLQSGDQQGKFLAVLKDLGVSTVS